MFGKRLPESIGFSRLNIGRDPRGAEHLVGGAVPKRHPLAGPASLREPESVSVFHLYPNEGFYALTNSIIGKRVDRRDIEVQ